MLAPRLRRAATSTLARSRVEPVSKASFVAASLRPPPLARASNNHRRYQSTGSSSSSKQEPWTPVELGLLTAIAGYLLWPLLPSSKKRNSLMEGSTSSPNDTAVVPGAPDSTDLSSAVPPPPTPNLEAALASLRKYFASRSDSISTANTDLESKGYSSWCQHDASLPSAVLFPESTEDVVAIVNACRENNVPLVPFAGGTSLEAHWYAPKDSRTGQTIPTISVCFEKMDQLVELDEASAFARVQPGLGWQVLNEELKSRGSPFFFPIDPGPGSCFAGMLATGGSGTGAVKYGTMRGEMVLNLTVVLPSGEVIKTRSDARKSSMGPDLTRLFLGSEGILGVITEATVRLAPRLPESVLTVAFDNVDDACRAVSDVLNKGIGVSSIELLDDLMIKAINFASKPEPLHAERPSLFIKFSGSKVHTQEDQRLTRDIVARHGADLKTVRLSSSEEEVEALWESRKVALWSAMQYRGEGARCWTTDVCVPIARLPELVKKTKKDLADHNLVGPIVGHAGDGNFHCLIVYKGDDKEEFKRAEEVVHRMVHLAQDLGGTATGEHGVGRGKREYLERELGAGTVNLLRGIKEQLDPTGFMNPGALLLPAEGATGLSAAR